MRLFFIVVFISQLCQAQKILKIVPLSRAINETSGLEIFNNHFLTHNDSGGKAALYAFNEQGEILATYAVIGAKNKDWEDIAMDKEYVYIGDHGNNFASREGLKIYKTKWDGEAFQTIGKIRIRYKAQKNFTKRGINAFDAEGLTVCGDALLLFSKNREKQTTEVYKISKEPGEYVLSPLKSVAVNALITGADYQEKTKVLALVGYTFDGRQFLYRVQNFDSDKLNFDSLEKVEIPHTNAQIEAVKIMDQENFWLTSEEEKFYGQPELIRVQWK